MELVSGTSKAKLRLPLTALSLAGLALTVLVSAACDLSSQDEFRSVSDRDEMSVQERRIWVEELRIEYASLPEWRLEEAPDLTAERELVKRQLGLLIPEEDIVYGTISCPEARMIQRTQIIHMRALDEDVPDSVIENNERYASAQFVLTQCRENAPTPTPVPVEVEVTAMELASDYAANEVAADRMYKGKHARITGVVMGVGAGQDMTLSDGTSVSVGAYVLIHPEIPCFVRNKDSLAPLVQGRLITIQGKVLGYRWLGDGVLATKIIDVLSCSIVTR